MTADVSAFHQMGWQIAENDGRLELVTGTVVDALEVPRTAGTLASQWWLYTDGYPDEVRRLPSLPPPGEAMAVITAGDSFYFLTQAGICPWTTQDPLVTRTTDRVGQPVIGWHSHASRIPFPSGNGTQVAWAHLPTRRIQLPCPAVLLHLLATATTTIQHGSQMITLPGDVLAIPVLGDGEAAHPPTPAHSDPAVSFGFRRDQRF
jgi:hypothetical protein